MLLSNWHFPPVPVLLVVGGLSILFLNKPRTPLTGLAILPILAFVYANVFPMYFARTGFSISSTVAATSLPCLCLTIFLRRLFSVKIADRAQYSDKKATKDGLLAFVGAGAIIVATAYTPNHCFNAKCKLGTILIGPSPFADFWFASFFGGFATFGCLAALYLILQRRMALRR
ncbi:hypothetical protein [Rhizobium leguminosarum]|uniref:hypothetical protein n=1 Tax=Rhizobium leguminosarum TaxID=384 RepID=UPI00102FD471|nr:hypothetical protein [Rhizobium leguminosarum]TAV76209.1 hypothetical protein ELI28_22905 [Rhizobium leguminosarum]TAV80808.1 hypothetical protein ELI27_22890 [Rhizobium leguminosarum]TAZ32534.1 hypothetical protein ELH73_22895 [Rhizobium leguminosarum]